MTSEAQSMKQDIDKLDISKIKNSCSAQGIVKSIKTQGTNGERISADPISHEGSKPQSDYKLSIIRKQPI